MIGSAKFLPRNEEKHFSSVVHTSTCAESLVNDLNSLFELINTFIGLADEKFNVYSRFT